MIPNEAVEAVARTLHDGGEQSWLAWDDITPFGQEAYRNQARAALEAAAPHIRAQAIEEVAEHGYAYGVESISPQALWSRAAAERDTA